MSKYETRAGIECTEEECKLIDSFKRLAKRFYACYDKNTDCKIYIPEKCKYCCKPSLKYYDAVRFRYGYTKRTMLFKLNGISIGKGHSEWGAPDNEVFILKLGNRIN